jgi:hypothetical protein
MLKINRTQAAPPVEATTLILSLKSYLTLVGGYTIANRVLIPLV